MARNLIVSNEQTQTPSSPVIVQNLAALPGGVEVVLYSVDADYPGGVVEHDGQYFPKVLKAGHLVYFDPSGATYAFTTEGGAFAPITDFMDEAGGLIGIITEDAPAYRDGVRHKAICSIMVAGVVDAKQLPASYPVSLVLNEAMLVQAQNHIVFLNVTAE